jgi:carbon storage regulator
MLDLKRKVGESIIVDGNITIKVKSIENGVALIGVAAPKEMVIDRKEVHRRKVSQGIPGS